MGSLKLRILIALLLAAAATWAFQAGELGRKSLTPVLEYTARKDYKILEWGKYVWGKAAGEKAQPVFSSPLQVPCQYDGVARHFGWYVNPEKGAQAFNPGVVLKVGTRTEVYPVLRGQVVKTEYQENSYEVVLRHGSDFTSVIRGLRKINVEVGQRVEEDTELGWASELVYIEMRNREGPFNLEPYLAGNGAL